MLLNNALDYNFIHVLHMLQLHTQDPSCMKLMISKDQPIGFYFYPLCYTAVLLKFIYYAQYYAQEQELLSDYILHPQLCMKNSLHIL